MLPTTLPQAEPSRFWRHDAVVALVFLALACLLVFPELGDRALWTDEAETALVSENILRTGLPLGWDGKNLVTQVSGNELTQSFYWAWTPWMQHYTGALGMAVMGKTSLGARWPFALLGVLTLPLFYLFLRRISPDRVLATVATAILLINVQYLLFLRQCRYYAWLPFLFITALWCYHRLPGKRATVGFVLSLILAFHSNYVSCAIMVSGLGLHALFLRRRAVFRWPMLVGVVVFAMATISWVLASGFLKQPISRRPFDRQFVGTILMTNRAICPWLLALIASLTVFWRKRRVDGVVALFWCMVLPAFFFLPRFLWPNPRYVPFLIPLGALLIAKAILDLFRWNRVLGLLLAALSLGTHLFILPLPALYPTRIGRQWFSGEIETGEDTRKLGVFKSEYADYAYELTHAVVGPDEELVRFLETHAQPKDRIAATDNWLPLMFHTDLSVVGHVRPDVFNRPGWNRLPRELADLTQARWLVIRAKSAWIRPDILRRLDQAGVVVEKTYRLPIKDVEWINRPMLSVHVFRPVPEDPPQIEILQLARR